MEEIWKDIEGYEGLYQVSNTGKVKRLNYRNTGNDRILKAQIRNRKEKYLSVNLVKNKSMVSHMIHRIVAKSFIPNPDNLDYVMHMDDNPSNNNFINLKWGTPGDNTKDMVLKKRHFYGELTYNNKLTDKDVLDIRKLFTGEFGQLSQLARKYKIDSKTVRSAIDKKTWKHI